MEQNISTTETIKIGNSTYIVERHFTEKRSLEQAIYAIIVNESQRNENGRKSA